MHRSELPDYVRRYADHLADYIATRFRELRVHDMQDLRAAVKEGRVTMATVDELQALVRQLDHIGETGKLPFQA
jgi:hypothetical protein